MKENKQTKIQGSYSLILRLQRRAPKASRKHYTHKVGLTHFLYNLQPKTLNNAVKSCPVDNTLRGQALWAVLLFIYSPRITGRAQRVFAEWLKEWTRRSANVTIKQIQWPQMKNIPTNTIPVFWLELTKIYWVVGDVMMYFFMQKCITTLSMNTYRYSYISFCF